MLKMILCIDKENGIAKNNQLAWNIKEEMQHFKNTTINKIVVMGYNTFLSLNKKTLPNRKNIIFSNKQNLKINNAKVTNDINYVLKLAKKNDVYIIGGKQIYQLFNKYCDEIILSKLNKSYNCDLFFEPNLKFFKEINTIEYNDFNVHIYKNYHHKILDGLKVKTQIQNELIKYKDDLIMKYKKIPKLVIIQVGNDYASSLYIKNKMKLAKEIGIDVELINFDQKISQKELNDKIIELNNNDDINGILVQSPLPHHLDINEVANLITPLKDVDCFNPYNAGLLFRFNFDLLKTQPCTPAGIIALLKAYNIKLEQKYVVVVGRSNIVTKPLAMLLLKENCTLSIVHSKTKNIDQYFKKADIIFSGSGKINLINKDNIKKNVIIVDISINRNENKIVGDANFKDILDKVKYITPVPGGVGPLTLIMLFKNILELFKAQYEKK